MCSFAERLEVRSTGQDTYSDPGATAFTCSLDGTAVACASPGYTAPSVGDGPHTFSAAGSDAFGNLDPTPATLSFTVDTRTPDDDQQGPQEEDQVEEGDLRLQRR